MKGLILIIGIASVLIGAAATPSGVIYFIYEWASNDVELKFALWSGVKVWMSMLAIGVFIGVPCYVIAK